MEEMWILFLIFDAGGHADLSIMEKIFSLFRWRQTSSSEGDNRKTSHTNMENGKAGDVPHPGQGGISELILYFKYFLNEEICFIFEC